MGVVCAICLNAFSPGDIVRELHCHHIFHSSCVEKWLICGGPSARCPMRCVPEARGNTDDFGRSAHPVQGLQNSVAGRISSADATSVQMQDIEVAFACGDQPPLCNLRLDDENSFQTFPFDGSAGSFGTDDTEDAVLSERMSIE